MKFRQHLPAFFWWPHGRPWHGPTRSHVHLGPIGIYYTARLERRDRAGAVQDIEAYIASSNGNPATTDYSGDAAAPENTP